MIRIERNTDNLFSLLQFIAFVINTFNRRFYSKRLPRKCKTTSRKEVRGFELATMQIQTGRGTSVPVDTCRQVFIHRYHPINIPTHLALTAVAVLNFAIIMVLYSSSAFMFISCSPAETERTLFFEFRTIIPLENHCFGDRPFLPFEVGRVRAIALISLAWLTLTT